MVSERTLTKKKYGRVNNDFKSRILVAEEKFDKNECNFEQS